MNVQISRVYFAGFSDCVEIRSPHFALTATTEIGPRILSFGSPGGGNLLWINPDDEGKRGGSDWRVYGGHRLWHAPEANPRSYSPDNDPVRVDISGTSVSLRQQTENHTGIEKEILLIPEADGHSIRIRHVITNRNLWAVELAPWAITAMAPGTIALVPVPHGPSGLLPVGSLAVWPYSDLSDKRFLAGASFLRISQEKNRPPFKIGSHAARGWCAGTSPNGSLLKRFPYVPGGNYPDFGSTVEVYTNEDMLELETLAPLQSIGPGVSVAHEEVWTFLSENIGGRTDAELVELSTG